MQDQLQTEQTNIIHLKDFKRNLLNQTTTVKLNLSGNIDISRIIITMATHDFHLITDKIPITTCLTATRRKTTHLATTYIGTRSLVNKGQATTSLAATHQATRLLVTSHQATPHLVTTRQEIWHLVTTRQATKHLVTTRQAIGHLEITRLEATCLATNFL